MLLRKLTGALTAAAIVLAPTAAIAQQAPAPMPSYESGLQLQDDDDDDDDGALFWILGAGGIALLIYFVLIRDGDGDDDEEELPESP